MSLLFSNVARTRLINFSIYMGTSVLNRSLPFFLLPILTRYLTPEEYGILALFQVLIAFVTPFVGMNMQNNITRNFFRETKEELAGLIFNLLLVLLGMLALVVSLFVLFSNPLAEISQISPLWLISIPIIAASLTASQLTLTVLRNEKKALNYGLFEIIGTALNLLVTLLFIVVYGWGWQGRAMGILLSAIVLGVASSFYLWSSGFLRTVFPPRRTREILLISAPLIFHSLGSVIINLSDRFIIEHLVGTAAVGIYSVGYQFGMMILLFTDSFNLVWSPWMYDKLSNLTEKSARQIVRFTYLYTIGVVVLAVLLSIASIFLLPLMTPSAYYNAIHFVFWVALGYAVRGMYTMVFPYLVFVGRTRFLGIITVLAAGINILFTYSLVMLNGAIGAAQATLISFVVLFLAVWWYANKVHPMPWKSSIFIR